MLRNMPASIGKSNDKVWVDKLNLPARMVRVTEQILRAPDSKMSIFRCFYVEFQVRSHCSAQDYTLVFEGRPNS